MILVVLTEFYGICSKCENCFLALAPGLSCTLSISCSVFCGQNPVLLLFFHLAVPLLAPLWGYLSLFTSHFLMFVLHSWLLYYPLRGCTEAASVGLGPCHPSLKPHGRLGQNSLRPWIFGLRKIVESY